MAKKETQVTAEVKERCIVCARGDWQEDPFTLVVYSNVPTPIQGEIVEGSWLDCQIKAGLLKVV